MDGRMDKTLTLTQTHLGLKLNAKIEANGKCNSRVDSKQEVGYFAYALYQKCLINIAKLQKAHDGIGKHAYDKGQYNGHKHKSHT